MILNVVMKMSDDSVSLSLSLSLSWLRSTVSGGGHPHPPPQLNLGEGPKLFNSDFFNFWKNIVKYFFGFFSENFLSQNFPGK